MEKGEKTTVIITVSLIVLALLFVFVIRPGTTGYATYLKIKDTNYTVESYGKHVSELETEALIQKTNASSCTSSYELLLGELKEFNTQHSQCMQGLATAETRLNLSLTETETMMAEWAADKAKMEQQLKDTETEKDKTILALESKYDSLAKNTANNLCCKAKIDNPDINYYDVKDEMVVCLETGDKELDC